MEKIRFGLVGFGAMGFAHAVTLLTRTEHAVLTAVSTKNEANLARLRAVPGGESVAVFDSPAAMYKSGEIDAVLIASPHRAHVAQAMEAFACGVHVLLEKPTGVTTAEVRRLNAAAALSGKAFGAMFNQRVSPIYREMKRIVAS